MKKLVIFDAMGVIYKTSDDVKYLLYPYLKDLDAELTFDQVNSRYMELSLGDITSKDLFASLGFGDKYPEIEKEYLDSRLELDPDFIETAESLKEEYDLAMLSNDAKEWSAYLRNKFKLDKYFAASVISGGAGSRKPSREIYEILLERTGRKASECVFIDDGAKNLEAADKLGFHTIWFDRNGDKSGWTGRSISGFSELHSVLRKIFG